MACKIGEAEAEAQEIENRLKAAQAPEVVALHPKALDRYLKTLTRLSESLSDPHQPEAMKLVHELVDSVVVYERKGGDPTNWLALRGLDFPQWQAWIMATQNVSLVSTRNAPDFSPLPLDVLCPRA